ncbi:MAG: transcriptional regulator, IclR family [Herminiimonas sp.]|nr:transcriptional regulator, IclR family [Herminiimonas sp.]
MAEHKANVATGLAKAAAPKPETRSSVAESRPARGASRAPAAYRSFAGDKQFATTLARGLALLMCFTPDRPQLANKDLCLMMDLPKGTVSRFTYTLCQLGYLCQVPGSTRYALGSAVVPVSYPLLANIALRQLARPLMDELASHVRGSVSLGIRDRLNIVFVETSRSRQALSSKQADIGLSYPIAASAIGRAYLAVCTAKERGAILNEIMVKAPVQWAQYEAALNLAMKDFGEHGFCVSYAEMRSEIVAVGVPFPIEQDGRKLVFNCAIHKFMASRDQVYAEIGPQLVAMVQSLAAKMQASSTT